MRLALVAIALLLQAPPARAEGGGGRWAGVGLTGGFRTFSSRLDLHSEAAIGMRVSVGVSDRVVVMIDAAHANPSRTTTGSSASFGDLRFMTAYRFLSGPWRPYLVAGLGGQFFNFHDAPGTAGGLLAGGAGLELSAGREWALFAEGTVDVYRAQYVRYDLFGDAVDTEPAETYGTGAMTIGAQYRF